METKTKIIIGVASVLTLGIGGYFIYRSMKNIEKEEEMYNSKKEGDIGYVEPKTTTTVTTPEQAGVPTVNPATTTPSIPNLGGFDLGSFGSTAATTTDENKPTNADYIRMADRWMTWDNVWKFAEKLGVDDKKVVGGVSGAYSTAIISNKSRKLFDSEVKNKFPNWKELLKDKASEVGVSIVSDNVYKTNTDRIKNDYEINMSYFSGSQNNPANFWTSGR